MRFDPTVVGNLASVVCPPYDVIGPLEQARLQAANPRNAVSLELPSDAPGEPGSRYRRAAETLARWQREGALKTDPRPAYYLHETRFTVRGERRRRRDLIAALGLEPWSAGAVLPHERTMAGPKADRLALLESTHANVSPVWVLSRRQPASLAAAWAATENVAPASAFDLDDEEHRLWVVDDPATVADVARDFAEGGPLYIADGHHRYETALAFKDGAGRGLSGSEAALAVVSSVDDPGLLVLPIHRVVRGLPARVSVQEIEARWSPYLHVEHYPVADPARAEQVAALQERVETKGAAAPTFGAYGHATDLFEVLELRGGRPPAEAMPADRSEAWRSLDVSLLHVLVLDPLLAEIDLPREEALSYTRSFEEAFQAVHDGGASIAFFLNPTRVDQILAVAEAGDRMPEKSTYFYPKPPTGLVIRALDVG